MKPTCLNGHEMVHKDEKECYECWMCDNNKEGEHWWCQSCWDKYEDKMNFCLECVSDIGNQDHIIFNKTVNDHLKFFEGLNSLITLSILIFQLAQTVTC